MARIIETVVSVLKSGYHRMTSPYGPRVDPISKKPGAMHAGIDLTGKGGAADDIIAIADGVVTYSRSSVKGYSPIIQQAGNYVDIKHVNGYVSKYCHMAYGTVKVKKGEQVKAGQVIGHMGTTGKSTGVHLHLSIIKNGKYVDPEPYLLGKESIIPPRLTGDVNGNGKVDSVDALMVKRAFAGTLELTSEQKTAADVDGDRKITSKDYLGIKRIFLGTFKKK